MRPPPLPPTGLRQGERRAPAAAGLPAELRSRATALIVVGVAVNRARGRGEARPVKAGATRPPSPEMTLLLAAARTQASTDDRARLRALAGAGIDWTRLQRLAEAHGVLPVVAHQLEASTAPDVPPGVRATLRARVLAHAARSIALGRELAAVLATLEARGLPALPYKGPALAAAVYGSPTLRQPGDLDLLVPDACLAGARAVLLDRGYRDALAGVDPEARVSHYQHAMVRDRDGIRLELHWALAPRYFGVRLPVAAIAREPLVLHGRLVAAIAPVDLLVVLAVHGARHCWTRLGWICDVAELLRGRPDLDGAAAVARAAALGARRMLLLAVALARDLLGAAPPDSLGAATAADRAAGALARRLGARILEERAGDSGLAAAAWLHLAMRERWRDRIAYAFLAPFTPSERDAPRAGSHAVRGLVRPLRLLRERRRRPWPGAPAARSPAQRGAS